MGMSVSTGGGREVAGSKSRESLETCRVQGSKDDSFREPSTVKSEIDSGEIPGAVSHFFGPRSGDRGQGMALTIPRSQGSAGQETALLRKRCRRPISDRILVP